MYQVLVQLDDREFVVVACRDEVKEAVHLIEELSAYWPREYVVRDSEGNNIDLTRYATIGVERGAGPPIR
jgi:hypothetical protein